MDSSLLTDTVRTLSFFQTNKRLCLLFISLMWAQPLFSDPLNETELPSLGDHTSSVVSPEQEKALGQHWLRALRAQAPLINDPFVLDYLRALTHRLASKSELNHQELELVVVASPAINAFAVPGGVIGANAGLFLHAQTEGELGSVLAHELAHLSQRHFARTIEEAQKNQWIQGAALLASVLLIATSNSESGYAALATTQAASVQSQLRFSRRNEQEADRIAIGTLAAADIDPSSIGTFFQRMQKTYQFSGQKPPEYLLTHPVTESRISEAKDRAGQYQSRFYPENTDFYLIKARIEALYTRDVQNAITRNYSQLNNSPTLQQFMTRYRLVMLLSKVQRYQEAEKELDTLTRMLPNNLVLQNSMAELKIAEKDNAAAIKLLAPLSKTYPDHYVLTLLYAQALLNQKNGTQALPMLESIKATYPNSPEIWDLLAQAYGYNQDMINVHLARAELLYIKGQSKLAIEQLQLARSLIDHDFPLLSKIETRISQMEADQKDVKF